MASYVSLGSYSGTLRIPEFKGLNQYGDSIGTDPRYAMETSGMLTKQGVLSPVASCEKLSAALPAPIETLARLYRRWYTDDHEVLVAASGGRLYWMLPGSSEWTLMEMPFGWQQPTYQTNVWSWVAYEINLEDSEAPVDVLLMSNALDGMICIRGDTMEVSPVATPKKFGVIARHAERIWGGGIPDDPDMLVYSAPYDPFNWSQNDEIPEDGAGDIMQPSWDGDSFTALTTFGSQLLAFKKNRVWRVLGTNPGEYVFKEQYGGGAAYANTVAVDGLRILTLGRDGLLVYNGETVEPYRQEYARLIFDRMNHAALDQSTACMYGDVYYCALPLDGSPTNNAVLMYNTLEQTFLLREDVSVEAFLPAEDRMYFTSAETPGRIWLWHEDGWDDDRNVQRAVWVSPWQNFGLHNVASGGFQVYLTVECKEPCALNIGIQTEKKLKKKKVVFSPPEYSRFAKQKRISFGGSGRRFRLIIESETEIPWRIVGGIQVEAETDVD